MITTRPPSRHDATTHSPEVPLPYYCVQSQYCAMLIPHAMHELSPGNCSAPIRRYRCPSSSGLLCVMWRPWQASA